MDRPARLWSPMALAEAMIEPLKTYRVVEIVGRPDLPDHRSRGLQGEMGELGLQDPPRVTVADLYFLEGLPGPAEVERVANEFLVDPVTQTFLIDRSHFPAGEGQWITVLNRPGVMDPVEESAVQGIRDLGIAADAVRVRTGRRYYFEEPLGPDLSRRVAERLLANPVIEEIHYGPEAEIEPFRDAVRVPFERVEIPIRDATDDQLRTLSRERCLSLDERELRTIQGHYRELGREPTDVELETLAQTWSEHCCHKTLTSDILVGDPEQPVKIHNLLKSTIARATEKIDAPWCLSVFKDNAGVIAFDDEYGVSFKVETHNHPSAIEPYGGAGTGIGGVIRDTLGTGLGARPIASTDVFCFGPLDLAQDELPPGTLHPLRLFKGVVAGVRDYGNRMGIPTVGGAICFHRHYVGNPLVYCGSVGLIPRHAIDKEVRPGDRILVTGGRTGRDGIHGATFSSVELTHESETVSSGAVQIGNPITEKKLLDALIEARDRGLYVAVTDCGAGGLSSAVGEMGDPVGARVFLERVPLKYEGLRYAEIWISEAQERMVLAARPGKTEELIEVFRSEGVEMVDIGEFSGTGRLELTYDGNEVGEIEMEFLHRGRPRPERVAEWKPVQPVASPGPAPLREPEELSGILHSLLSHPNIASKEWVIRQYDHEVQGGSVLKPLQGPEADGPGDAAALTPRLGDPRGIVLGCGINPEYGLLDPLRMALSAVDEAIRNVVGRRRGSGSHGAPRQLLLGQYGSSRSPRIPGRRRPGLLPGRRRIWHPVHLRQGQLE